MNNAFRPSTTPSAWRSFSVRIGVVALLIMTESATATPVTIDKFFTVQPIQVCDDAGGNCAPVSLYEPATKKIFSQAHVAPVFLPPNQINDSSLLNAEGVGEVNQVGNGQSTNARTINAWFVDELDAPPGSVLYGEGYLSGNGVAINTSAVNSFNSGVGRIDTLAHELGHNLGLGHNTLGAGGANNLMTNGSSRAVPSSVGDINPDGAQLSTLTSDQIDEIQSSPFVLDAPRVVVDTRGSTPFSTDDFFLVDFASGPTEFSLLKLTLDLTPIGAFFDSTNTPPGVDGSPLQFSSLTGISGSDITTSGGTNGSQTLTVNFAPDTFTVGDSLRFGIDIDLFSAIDFFGATPSQLVGMLFDFGFDMGLALQTALDADLVTESTTVTKLLPTSGPIDPFGPQVPPGQLPPVGSIVPEPFLPRPAPVPVPATFWLLTAGFMAMVIHSRRYRH